MHLVDPDLRCRLRSKLANPRLEAQAVHGGQLAGKSIPVTAPVERHAVEKTITVDVRLVALDHLEGHAGQPGELDGIREEISEVPELQSGLGG